MPNDRRCRQFHGYVLKLLPLGPHEFSYTLTSEIYTIRGMRIEHGLLIGVMFWAVEVQAEEKLGNPLRRHVVVANQPAIDHLGFSTDGKFAYSNGSGNLLKRWRTDTWESTHTVRLSRQNDGFAVSPDLSLFALGLAEAATLYHFPGGEPVTRLTHDAHVWSLTFSPDGKTFATASDSGHIQFLDVASMQITANVRVPIAQLSDRASNGLELRNGIKEEYRGRFRNQLFEIRWSPDGKYLALRSRYAPLFILDVKSKQLVQYLNDPTLRSVSCMAFSPDGKQLAMGTTYDTVCVYDLTHVPQELAETEPIPKAKELFRIRGFSKEVRTVAFSKDGSKLYTGDSVSTLYAWNLNNGHFIQRLQPSGPRADFLYAISLSPDGETLLRGSSRNDSFYVEPTALLHKEPPSVRWQADDKSDGLTPIASPDAASHREGVLGFRIDPSFYLDEAEKPQYRMSVVLAEAGDGKVWIEYGDGLRTVDPRDHFHFVYGDGQRTPDPTPYASTVRKSVAFDLPDLRVSEGEAGKPHFKICSDAPLIVSDVRLQRVDKEP